LCSTCEKTCTGRKNSSDKDEGRLLSASTQNLDRQVIEKHDKDKCVVWARLTFSMAFKEKKIQEKPQDDRVN